MKVVDIRLPIFVLAMLFPACFVTAQPVQEQVGINIHFHDAKPGEMDMLAGAGAKFVRIDMLWNQKWSATEKAKGVYDFSAYDVLFDDLKARGMGAICIFAYGNPLYDGGLSPHTDEGRQAFANWAVAAAKHFAGRGIYWEVWNEPNGRQFWKPTPNADDYAQLLVAVGKAFHEQLPDEKLIGPALSKFDWPYMQAVLQAGVLQYVSAVSVHPYRNADPESVAGDYRKLRRLVAEYAPPGKMIPIISSEWGYFQVLDANATSELQGKYLAREWLTNLSNEVPLSIWYDWKDDGTNPKDPEAHFGTVGPKYFDSRDPVYDPKPGYLAAKTFNATLGAFRFNKRMLIGDPTDHVLLFDRAGQTALAAWTEGTPHDLQIPASPGVFSVTSHTGQTMPALTADASGLKVPLTDAPQYLLPQAGNDYLSLLAAWDTLPLETIITQAGDGSVKSTLRNVTANPIQLTTTTGEHFKIPPGQTQAITLTESLPTDLPKPVRLELNAEGIGQLVQETLLQRVNPVVADIGPVGDHAVIATLRNPQHVSFTGIAQLNVIGDDKTVTGQSTVEFKPDAAEQSITVKTDQALPMHGTIELHLVDRGGADFAGIGCVYSSNLASGLGSDAFAMWPMKDQSLTASPASEQPPTSIGPVMKLDYAFVGSPSKAATQSTAASPSSQPAMLTLSITPSSKHAELGNLTGRPSRLVMWVYGDGSGNNIGARYIDAAGQTFQPSAGSVTWRGWRQISIRLDDPGVWHYGGTKEDVIDYPIRLVTLVLFDSAKKNTSSGTIYFASPTIVWD